MIQFPVNYSSLDTKALLLLVIKEYDLNSESSIAFIKRGFNDTYLITETNGKKFILRVYNHFWRTFDSIEAEIELLLKINLRGVNVSIPINNKQNEFYMNIEAPEGNRYAVLFSYAEGKQIRKLDNEQSYLLGIETGKLHLITKELANKNTAQNYDIEFSLNKTLRILTPILNDFKEELLILNLLKDDFTETFSTIIKAELVNGICHGDIQAENIHFSDSNKITFFDFDFFGQGYLVYDIGVFIWYDHKNKTKEIINCFIKGYETQRKLTETEIELLPYFSTLRALFQMTLYCELNDGYYLPQWQPQQIADFVKKIKKWHKSKIR